MFFPQYPYINLNDLNLDYILKQIKSIMAAINDLDDWRISHEAEYEQLKQFYDDLESGNFSDGFADALVSWYEANIVDIIGEFVKQIFFGLTDDGYFVAYIPESWSDIIFGTSGLDDFPVGIDYGHLTLSY